jgi:hypothetical protein
MTMMISVLTMMMMSKRPEVTLRKKTVTTMMNLYVEEKNFTQMLSRTLFLSRKNLLLKMRKRMKNTKMTLMKMIMRRSK